VGHFLQIAADGAFRSAEWIADRLLDLAFTGADPALRTAGTALRL
jgi:hypothetical protein